MSDDTFFGDDTEKEDDKTTSETIDLLEKFDDRDKTIIDKLREANDGIGLETIIKGFENTVSNMKSDIPIEELRENYIIATTEVFLRAVKSTKPFKFFTSGAVLKNFGKGDVTGKAYGFILEDDKKGKTKRAPTIIIRKSEKLSEVTAFLDGFRRFNTYNLYLSVQGDRKVNFKADTKNPNVFFANDITKFDEVTEPRPKALTTVKGFKELYGLKMGTVIENPAKPNSQSGLSEKQKGGKYVNENDFKMLLIQPTADPAPTKHDGGMHFSATAISDPNEDISVFCYNDDELIKFERGHEVIVAIGALTKANDATYSTYNMDMIAMQRVDYTEAKKYL